MQRSTGAFCPQLTMPAPILSFPTTQWFEDTFGFKEGTYEETQRTLMAMQTSSSDPSRKLRWTTAPNETPIEVTFGSFVTPTVQELRDECTRLRKNHASTDSEFKQISWRNVEGSVLDLLADPDNEGAVFQAASQFNCLEFVNQSAIPEIGITKYCNDLTQGPACAMVCGPGTAFRNYLVNMGNGDKGQREESQINTLQPIMDKLTECNNGSSTHLHVKNGYALVGEKEMRDLHKLIHSHQDELTGLLQVGIQRDTEVTYPILTGRLVTQVYCSAVPVSYSSASADAWQPLARLILRGSYEATLLEGVRQHLLKQQQSPNATIPPTKVFLTLVGGGVFGNEMHWIYGAMEYAHRSATAYGVPLDIRIVHHRNTPLEAEKFVKRIYSKQARRTDY